MDITDIVQRQRQFFATGVTLHVDYRIRQLTKLRDAIQKREKDIAAALQQDLGKSAFEGYLCETGMALSEISYMLRHVRSFAREKTVPTAMAQFPARSSVKPMPYGNVLIMSPWNYPFLLTMEPLADAIAAGNTVVLKPSAYSPATSALVADLVASCFPPEYVAVVTGGRQENAALLEQKFDLVFFTGSQAVGKEVLRHCAEHLTPAVLELGGKSPCIVDETANLPMAARRIVFGKFLNCGQTCVAPDYILCAASVKDRLIQLLQEEMVRQYGATPLHNPDYGHIVSEKHFNRLMGLLDPAKVVKGGSSNPAALQIEPTLMDHVSWSDPVMGEEIFGPILPVLTFQHFSDIYAMLQDRQKPLALYLFSQDKTRIAAVKDRIPSGGMCINDTVIHLATCNMGFGGVGESGMGSYHGLDGFKAFSHTRSILDKKAWMDIPIRYQPYHHKSYMALAKLFLR